MEVEKKGGSEATTSDGRVCLAQAVRECYEGVGMRQTQVAARTGLLQSQISRYSSGKDRPALEIIRTIEEACGRRKGWVLARAGFVDIPSTLPQMILMDPSLSHEAQVVLLASYRALSGKGE